MSRSSRIKLAKELLHCARMVLGESRLKEVKIERIAKKIVANYAYDDLRKLVVSMRPQLIEDVKKYGVFCLKHSGFVIHHLNKTTTHFIESGRNNDDYKRMINVLKDSNLAISSSAGLQRNTQSDDISKFSDAQLRYFLELEMNNIILLPAWYHNYLHDIGKQFRTKEKCYEFMITIVKRVIRNRKNNKTRVKALEFNGNSIKTAIDSIQNLATVVNNQNKMDIINGLADVFQKIQKKILQDN